MTATWERFLFWGPRILAILFAGFLAIFAADVFSETHGFWSTAAALLLHLIPSGVILLILVLAWRRELLGGVFYLALGVVNLVARPGTSNWTGSAAVSGPLVVIALLFFAHWLLRKSRLSQTPSH